MFGMRLRERGYVNAKITQGPHKDRKGWFGIGLRADNPSPEDPDDGIETPPNPPSGGSDGPLGEALADDRPLDVCGGFAGGTSGSSLGADDSGPLNQKVPSREPRMEKDVEKRSASSASSANSSSREELPASSRKKRGETVSLEDCKKRRSQDADVGEV